MSVLRDTARSWVEVPARRKRLVVVALLVAVTLRLLAVACADLSHTVLTWDLSGYDAAAQRLVTEGTYAYPLIVYDSPAIAPYWKMRDFGGFTAPTIDAEGLRLFKAAERNAHVLPGYPAFLAAIYLVTGVGQERLLGVAIVQAFLSALTVYVVYRIATRVGDKTALVAVVLSALYIPSVLIVASILTETLYALLLSLLVLAALRMAERKSLLSASIVGAIFGASLWVRPTALPCALALLFVLALAFRGQALRRFVLLVFVALVIGAVALSPWWVRNATLYGRWVPFATYASHPLLMGYYADRGMQTEALKLITPLERPRNDYELGRHWDRLAAEAGRETLRHPLESVLLRARRVISSLVRPDGFDAQWSWTYGLLVLAQVALLCMFAVGFVSAINLRQLNVLAIASVPLAVVALQAAVIPLTRYYVAVAPLAMIVVAYGLLRLLGAADSVQEDGALHPWGSADLITDRGRAQRDDSLPPLVSVLTPSFNQAAWLSHNLRSVACQTYPRIEHIVMDGGSSDGTVDVLNAAGDSIRWKSEADEGQADAINKAFRESSGDIIGWINSDDAYFDCRVIEDVVAYFAAHPEVDVVYGHAAQIAEDGTIIWMIWVPWFMRRVLKIVNFIGQPVAFIRRSALSEPMLDETYHFAMDYELWLRLDREGHPIRRMSRITAVDRHHSSRKGMTMTHVLQSDLGRLAETHGRGYPRAKALLSWGFYAWRRFMGIFLIPRIPNELAFTVRRTSRWDIFRRQALSWNKAWPADFDAGP